MYRNEICLGCTRRGLLGLMLTAVVLCAAGIGSASAETRLYEGKPAKYILLFIGDGVGLPQRTAAEQYQGQRLLMDELPYHGITATYAANRFITGSAAASTAMACGQKTKIGMVGVAPNGAPVKSVAEMARDQGMKVGIVSSVSLDHATPAAFYSHVKSRKQYYDIEVALAESGFDFFGGGGLKDPTNKKSLATDFRGDARELMKEKGYRLVTNRADFMALTAADGKIVAWNESLPDGKALPYTLDMTEQDITLQEFTSRAIEILDNDKGFFLMVEGGKIDWACHANDAATAVTDTIAFDEAVRVGVEFAEAHPEETLVVVTGDHECGGLTLGWSGTQYESYFGVLKNQVISFQKFSDEVVKKYKEQCGGTCSFDDMKPLITKYFGLKFEGDPDRDRLVLKDYQLDMVEDAYARSMAGEKETASDPATERIYGMYEPLTVTLTHILNNKAGLAWTSYKHTGVPVITSALGVGGEIFQGYYDNTDIALKIMSVMGVEAKVHSVSRRESEKTAAK